ncbi:MAG: ABC transporter permease [Terriglobales bacterium]
MNKMVLANLLHRPVRSIVTVVAVAVEVTLILLMVGLATGLLSDYKQRQEGIGGDVVVRPPNASMMLSLSNASMSIKVGDVLAKMPHVKVVSPIVAQVNPGGLELIFGIDPKSFTALGGPFQYVAGGPFTGPYDVIIDQYFAEANHVKVGDTTTVMNNAFRVSGIVIPGRGARKFIPIATMQDLSGSPGKASVFFVKLDDPRNIPTVIQTIKNYPGLGSYSVYSMREYLSMFTVASLPGLSYFITVVIAVAVIIGFIVIFQAMYAAVMERTRDIGILKSLGASRLYIMNVILRETVALAIIGIILGIGISYATRCGIVTRIPTLRVIVPPYWVGYAAAIAIVGAVLGATYPAIKAARKDPIEALAYE